MTRLIPSPPSWRIVTDTRDKNEPYAGTDGTWTEGHGRVIVTVPSQSPDPLSAVEATLVKALAALRARRPK